MGGFNRLVDGGGKCMGWMKTKNIMRSGADRYLCIQLPDSSGVSRLESREQ